MADPCQFPDGVSMVKVMAHRFDNGLIRDAVIVPHEPAENIVSQPILTLKFVVKSLMEDVYVARQPIFDKNKHIYAYELLFRDGTANHVPDIDGDEATTTLLANTFFTIGMDTLAGGRKLFINYTQNLLEKKIPLLLPKETTVIEILEDVKPNARVDRCLRANGCGRLYHCPG
jgi:hypothetical protein